ncbi:MAG: hypothetical protein ACE5HI_16580, partial [bacterium]
RILGKMLYLKNIRIHNSEMVAEFAPQLLNINGEPFKNWLGSMVVNAIKPFEFTQNEGLGIRLKLESHIENKILFVNQFLQSLKSTTAKVVTLMP